MTVGELIREGAKRLYENGNTDAQNDARLFAMSLLDTDYTGLIMRFNEEASLILCESYRQFIDRRLNHEPAQYIIGNTCFMGYDFLVEKNVLIPRPETELLVSEAYLLTAAKDDIAALDMCCGTGCIGISYKLYRKEKKGFDTKLVLSDISDDAIALSKKNDELLGCGGHIIKSDLFENIYDKFDIILSNPPYIRTSDIAHLEPEVREHEPYLALDGHEDGLYFYMNIIKAAKAFLRQDGILVFEIGCDQYEDIKALLLRENYTDIRLKKDYAGQDRVISAKIN